jgi:archaemetzincin
MVRPSLYYSLLLTVFVLSCSESKRYKDARPGKQAAAADYTIAVLPFSGIDPALVTDLKAGLEKRLTAEVIILAQKPLPVSAFYQPRRRYIADKLLLFLKQHNDGADKIIGITGKDISTRKGSFVNWGIMGLGNCPGEACIISSFRAKSREISYQRLADRMILLALHELGHTWSLPHCLNTPCIMKDADGKMNLDDGDSYCDRCSAVLRKAGILRPV